MTSRLDGWIDGLAGGRRGTLVQRKRERCVWRVSESGETWYVKRGTGSKRSEVRREAATLDEMAAAGVPVTPVLAAGEREDAFWLVTGAAPGVSLAEALATAPGPQARRLRLETAASVARAVHDLRFSVPDLTASHVFLDGTRATLLDVARARRRRRIGLAARARDLAALVFSLPYGTTTRADRVRLLRDGSAGAGPLREVVQACDREIARLRRRTRWRHAHAGASTAVRAALADLGRAGAVPLYDALLDPSGMEVVRTLPDRENRRFGEFHMKVYPAVRRGLSPAMRERDAIDLFARAGVPTCREAAYGEDVDRGSFVVVERCAGVPLDDLLRAGVSLAERRALCRATARIWRRMRDAGLRHRDAYPCHVFAGRDAAGSFDLRLIDLSRAGRAPLPRERWFVKDAAQLWYGAPKPPVTRTDAVRWLREYFGVPRLDSDARRFARRVAAKARRIAAHQRADA